MRDELKLRFAGTAPLLMRSGRMADPLDEHAVALARVTSKRLKTRADHEAIARLEWRGSLWLADGRPCVPAEAVEAALVAAAKSRRAGSLVRAAAAVRDSAVLDHSGPADLDALFADKRHVHRCGVKVSTRTTIRTRPRFDAWSIAVTVDYLPHMIDRASLVEIACIAGATVGIGDFRPRFGTFRVEEA